MSCASNALCGTAFQEAGHAVVARYFGLTVTEIEILEDATGKIAAAGTVDALPLIDRIAIHCAGEASRTVFKCRSHALAGSDDNAEISKLVEGLTEDCCLEVRNAGYRRAIEIVKSNSSEVERLASLLNPNKDVSTKARSLRVILVVALSKLPLTRPETSIAAEVTQRWHQLLHRQSKENMLSPIILRQP